MGGRATRRVSSETGGEGESPGESTERQVSARTVRKAVVYNGIAVSRSRRAPTPGRLLANV